MPTTTKPTPPRKSPPPAPASAPSLPPLAAEKAAILRDVLASKPAPTPSQLTALSNIVGKRAELAERIAKGESLLATLKAELRTIDEEHLPNLMDAVGMQTFTTKDGFEVEVKPIAAVNPTVADRPQVYAWLREHGHGGLIKTKVTAFFDKGKALTDKLRKQLEKLGVKLEVDESVHAQTLGAWAREMHEQGKLTSLPEFFKVYVGNRATVKQSRSEK